MQTLKSLSSKKLRNTYKNIIFTAYMVHLYLSDTILGIKYTLQSKHNPLYRKIPI